MVANPEWEVVTDDIVENNLTTTDTTNRTKNTRRKDVRMKYSKNFKDFMSKKEPSLRVGEVKRYDKTLGRYVSNKD